MQIGDPIRTIIVEPVEDPFRETEPQRQDTPPLPAPAPTPERSPEKVPA